MPFVRSASPRYFAPASFTSLDAEGRLVVSKFDCQFKRHKKTELDALQADVQKWAAEIVLDLRKAADAALKAVQEGRQIDATAPTTDDHATVHRLLHGRVLDRVMTGWRGVQEPDGSELEFSLESLERTEEEFPGFVNACAEAFWKSCMPKEAAHLAAKN